MQSAYLVWGSNNSIQQMAKFLGNLVFGLMSFHHNTYIFSSFLDNSIDVEKIRANFLIETCLVGIAMQHLGF